MAILFNASEYHTGGYINTGFKVKRIDFGLSVKDGQMYDRVHYRLYVSIEGQEDFYVQAAFSQPMIKDGNVLTVFSEMCRGEMQVRGVPDEAIKCMEVFLQGDNPTHGLYQFLQFDNPASAMIIDGPTNYRQPEVDRLPGLKEIVKHPVNPDYESAGIEKGYGILEFVIISLNDKHNWTRDQIADWLETLDIDLTFKEQQEETIPLENYLPKKGEFNLSVKEMKAYLAQMKYQESLGLNFNKNDIIGGTIA